VILLRNDIGFASDIAPNGAVADKVLRKILYYAKLQLACKGCNKRYSNEEVGKHCRGKQAQAKFSKISKSF